MYKKMYLHLFNAVTDSLDAMTRMNYGEAYQLLKKAQAECEDIYLDGEDGEGGEEA